MVSDWKSSGSGSDTRRFPVPIRNEEREQKLARDVEEKLASTNCSRCGIMMKKPFGSFEDQIVCESCYWDIYAFLQEEERKSVAKLPDVPPRLIVGESDEDSEE